ncbi:DUF2177 family protein [Oryzifoliimicrobium ureilyticus]|uniref:DUF2177 family protein n=1 Tax=Oryzifoliimicrobium ureilyticus TaxID=3113724 RepID=UPI00307655AF
MTVLIAYGGSLLCFLMLDGIWLGLVARKFYKNQLGDKMLPSPRIPIAALFYLLFTAAVVILAVMPAVTAHSPAIALTYGAVLGLAAFGTYDMTNLSTLKDWPLKMSIVDLAWGTFVTAASSYAGYFAASLAAAG